MIRILGILLFEVYLLQHIYFYDLFVIGSSSNHFELLLYCHFFAFHWLILRIRDYYNLLLNLICLNLSKIACLPSRLDQYLKNKTFDYFVIWKCRQLELNKNF